ncbi:endonuclease/exonuclease/phosphatase family protein [soil metagenome]
MSRELSVISLNSWGGKLFNELLTFLQDKAPTTDIFCFQEVYSTLTDDRTCYFNEEPFRANLFQEYAGVLPGFEGYYAPQILNSADHLEGLQYGLAAFVKKGVDIHDTGDVFVHESVNGPDDITGFHARNIQYLHLKLGETPFTIFNFHGLWNGQGKTDTSDRLKQSDRIIEVMDRFQNDKLLIGDYNLNPDTESLQKLEEHGLVNLITAHGVTSTRSSHYSKEGKYADYALLSPGVQVQKFEVLPDEVSDHLPLHLTVSL